MRGTYHLDDPNPPLSARGAGCSRWIQHAALPGRVENAAELASRVDTFDLSAQAVLRTMADTTDEFISSDLFEQTMAGEVTPPTKCVVPEPASVKSIGTMKYYFGDGYFINVRNWQGKLQFNLNHMVHKSKQGICIAKVDGYSELNAKIDEFVSDFMKSEPPINSITELQTYVYLVKNRLGYRAQIPSVRLVKCLEHSYAHAKESKKRKLEEAAAAEAAAEEAALEAERAAMEAGLPAGWYGEPSPEDAFEAAAAIEEEEWAVV